MIWTRFRKRLWRALMVGLAILMFLVCIGIAYQSTASAQDRQRFTPLGSIVEVNGQSMHLYCIGQGSPTVILENGVGGNTLLWAYVQPTIAEVTRVCAYDRAGYGWSEASPAIRTSLQITEELHTLLAVAEIEPPYVLVGHSFGGLVIRTFASVYPDEVAGLVFVDAAHPNQFSTDHCVPACFPSSAVQLVDHFYGMLPTMAQVGLVRLLVPQGKLPLPFFAIPSDFPDRDALIALFSSNSYSRTVSAEWSAFPQSAEFVRGINHQITLPLRFVTAVKTYYDQPLPGEDPNKSTETWLALQNDLHTISSNSEQTMVEDANHFSLLINPNHSSIVSKVVIDLLESLSH
jgi:pimeloyl-ACP methyl ester carboxylesterase